MSCLLTKPALRLVGAAGRKGRRQSGKKRGLAGGAAFFILRESGKRTAICRGVSGILDNTETLCRESAEA